MDTTNNLNLEPNDAFCILPWVHMHISTKGDMCACCVSFDKTGLYTYGNLNENSFNELWQGENIRSLRKDFLSGRKSPNCQYCYELDSSNNLSNRKYYNNYFKDNFIWALNTDINSGFAPDAKPIYWDLRFSNKCNLRCRMCSHMFSSSWFKESTLVPSAIQYGSEAKITALDNPDKLFSQLEVYFSDIELLYFAGGEPLLIDEYYQLLKKLDNLKINNIDILYNSNFIYFNMDNYKLLNIWNRFHNVKIQASLDDNWQRGEYIRYGLEWNHIVNNRKIMIESFPNIAFLLTPTLSVFNIWHLPDFYREWVELGLIELDQIEINILEYPNHLSVRILPVHLKKEIREKYIKLIDWICNCAPVRSETDFELLSNKWYRCIEYMESKDYSYKTYEFLAETYRLDILRNNSFKETFPELCSLYDYTPSISAKQKEIFNTKNIILKNSNTSEVYLIGNNTTIIIDKKHFSSFVDIKNITLSISNECEEIELLGTLIHKDYSTQLIGWYQKIQIKMTDTMQNINMTINSPIKRHVILSWLPNISEDRNNQNNIALNSIIKHPKTIQELQPDSEPLLCKINYKQTLKIPIKFISKKLIPKKIVIQIAIMDDINIKLNGYLEFKNIKKKLSGWYADIYLDNLAFDRDIIFDISISDIREIQFVWWCIF